MPHGDVAAIVLASGRSRRFADAGGAEPSKLLAKLDGEPLVRHALAAALASSARPVILVTGHEEERVKAAVHGLPARVVHNSDFATGVASSLRAGIAALAADAAAALILLADMPRVDAALLDRLIAAFGASQDALVVAPRHGGGRGNPVLLARELFADLARLKGDEGARRIVDAVDPRRRVEIADPAGHSALDVDTPAALAALADPFTDG
jgi:molybdenum cofactor cytidylyltransferase